MLKKYLVPGLTMIVGIIGAVYEFSKTITEPSLEDVVKAEVERQLGSEEDSE